KASVNNKNAARILNTIRGWVGTIAPRDVTSFQEADAHTPFINGDVAFMRNWPYAYALANATGSKVKGKVGVSVLPHSGKNKSVGTVGGWQVGVSKYSKHKGASIELVRYLTSPAVERFDAIFNSNVPTIPKVALMKSVRKVNPWLIPSIANVPRVTRPSKYLKGKYQQGSTYIFQAMAQIEKGANATSVLPDLHNRPNRVVGRYPDLNPGRTGRKLQPPPAAKDGRGPGRRLAPHPAPTPAAGARAATPCAGVLDDAASGDGHRRFS